jgi:hypothetical protein
MKLKFPDGLERRLAEIREARRKRPELAGVGSFGGEPFRPPHKRPPLRRPAESPPDMPRRGWRGDPNAAPAPPAKHPPTTFFVRNGEVYMTFCGETRPADWPTEEGYYDWVNKYCGVRGA